MKNQYFGDINDYRKYGLLRILASQFKIGMGWMLTPDDTRTDGKFIDYLNKPNEWRHYDPPLFDSLYRQVITHKNRDVRIAETELIIPNGVYFPPLLTDNQSERQIHFQEMMSLFAPCDLIFLDPDNGLEVKSVPKGKKESCKYVYWDEIESIFHAKKSILFYQHFQRVERNEFIQTISQNLISRLGASSISAFRTSNVVFFFIPQADVDIAPLREKIATQWKTQIDVSVHPQ
jgi:hypothetical protein